MRAIFLAAILCSSASMLGATPRPNLTGTVLDSDGKPLAEVTVMVYHAGVKVGYSTYCPSYYVDCGKRTVTDAKGSFEIKDVSPDLWFTLLAAREGYIPQMAKSIDPSKNPTVILKLAAKPPITDFSGTVRGRVIQADGSPISGATVDPRGLDLSAEQMSTIMGPGAPVLPGVHSIYGNFKGLQPIAVTNKRGEFEISYDQPTPKMLLRIEARAMAPTFVVLETGSQRQSVTLTDGATITGRLIANGKPIPNAQIGLIPKNRGGFGDHFKISGSPYEEIRIGTGPDGRFILTNVPFPVDWYLYAKMESISSLGATTPIEIQITKDGEYLKASDLVIKPGYRVRGSILVADNKPIPDGMRISISSKTVWDSQTKMLAADGHFEFNNLASGEYTIFPSVKGYHEKLPQYGPTPFSVDTNIDNFTTTIYPNHP